MADPIELDQHRGMAAQRATEIRRHLAEVEADQQALRARQLELEHALGSAPASTWQEAVARAGYLLGILADSPEGRDPRRQSLIHGVLADFQRLSDASGPEPRD